MRLLVTGGTGQVGEALGRLGAEAGIAVDLPGRADLDLMNPASIAAAIAQSPAALVVNCAAYTQVDRAERESDQAMAVNAAAPGHLAAACAKRRLPLIQLSTDYVFDGGKPTPYRESDQVAPEGVYARSKEEGERRVREAWDRHLILRVAWVYSARGQNFLKTMLRLANEKSELSVVDDQIGTPTAADDIARAVLAIARQLADDPHGRWGTYHYAAEGSTSWHGFAEAIIEAAAPLTGKRPAVKPIPSSAYPTPVKRPANSVLDCAKVVTAFGPPRRPWRTGMTEVLSRLLAEPRRGAA